jgi:uncharacterized protein (TIGR03790 family)
MANMTRRLIIVIKQLTLLMLLALPSAIAVAFMPTIELPASGLSPRQVAVVFIEGDLLSEKIAQYYQSARNIPLENIVSISFDPEQQVVDPGVFAVQKKVIDAKLGENIQAYALAWAQPYRVGCMSMSAAFTLGYDVAYCAVGCKLTRTTAYYHSGSVKPYADFGIRPTMLLAADNLDQAKALIDRGVAADDTQPFGRAFLLATSDQARSVRKRFFSEVQQTFGDRFDVQVLEQDTIENKSDVLFYFTGAQSVEGLDTLKFLSGAMADHLTSYGGMLTDSGQMSAMRWLEAGATGSYGTAIEPCAFVQKFPNPLLAMWHYASGSTLMEAYWKSVHMPGQGNFIGEPLAAPFRGYRLQRVGRALRIHSPVLRTGRYQVYTNDFGIERMRKVHVVNAMQPYIELWPPYSGHYRLERAR